MTTTTTLMFRKMIKVRKERVICICYLWDDRDRRFLSCCLSALKSKLFVIFTDSWPNNSFSNRAIDLFICRGLRNGDDSQSQRNGHCQWTWKDSNNSVIEGLLKINLVFNQNVSFNQIIHQEKKENTTSSAIIDHSKDIRYHSPLS